MRRSATLPVTDFQNVVHCKIAASNLFRRRMSEDVLMRGERPFPPSFSVVVAAISRWPIRVRRVRSRSG